jgi:nickel/cobalt exporter
MGFWIVWRKTRALISGAPEACDPDCDHDHGGDPRAFERARTGELVLTAIGAGIRPCTGAIILLVFALAKGLFLAGAISVAAMAVGTAIGTSLFALLAVKAKSTALGLIAGRSGGWSRLVALIEIAAGLALAALGLALLAGAMSAGS